MMMKELELFKVSKNVSLDLMKGYDYIACNILVMTKYFFFGMFNKKNCINLIWDVSKIC